MVFNIFPQSRPPPDGGGAVAHDGRVASTHQRVDPGQRTRGGEDLGDEHKLRIKFIIMIMVSEIFRSYHTLLRKVVTTAVRGMNQQLRDATRRGVARRNQLDLMAFLIWKDTDPHDNIQGPT